MKAALIAAFQAAAESLLDTFGASATYTHGGVPITVQAVVETSLDLIGEYGEKLEGRPIVTLNRAEVSEPQRGDTLECNGVTYAIDGVLTDRSDDYTVVAALRVVT